MPAESALIAALKAWLLEIRNSPSAMLLTAPSGAGKTHLLLSLAAAAAPGVTVSYLPLSQFGPDAAMMVNAQPVSDAVLIDDLQQAEHDPDLQLALFALHNRQRDAGAGLIYAGRGDPHDWPQALPDLVSRLGQCTRFNIPLMNEDQRRHWFARQAERLGLVLEAAALDYVFRRVGRDMHSLTQLLQQLNHASLVQQRKVTVPFLRQVLAEEAMPTVGGPD